MKITGVLAVAGCERRACRVDRPSMPGIMMSSSSRSGRARSAALTAAGPSAQEVTVKPPTTSSAISAITRMSASSST
jgi:hypothetical protein